MRTETLRASRCADGIFSIIKGSTFVSISFSEIPLLDQPMVCINPDSDVYVFSTVPIASSQYFEDADRADSVEGPEDWGLPGRIGLLFLRVTVAAPSGFDVLEEEPSPANVPLYQPQPFPAI
jgi:hypothetical protein